jgi:putative DNA methylase
VIAWIWARTVASPNPAAQGAHVPLISTFWLSSKKGQLAWLKPAVDKSTSSWRLAVQTGEPANRKLVSSGTKAGKGSKFTCLLTGLLTGVPIKGDYIQEQGKAGRIGYRLIAVVADLGRGRTYLAASDNQTSIVEQATPSWYPEELLSTHPQYMGAPRYGMARFGDLFTPRQLTTMVILSDLVKEICEDVGVDARKNGLSDSEAEEYAKTVTTFLALALDRCADFNNGLCTWNSSNQKVMHLFGRQAIPMVWDFAEANILGDSVGAWQTCEEYVAKCIDVVGKSCNSEGNANQIDAAGAWNDTRGLLVSTDPPTTTTYLTLIFLTSSMFGYGER